MATEHYYIVTYDISDPKRLRRVFRLLKGYGEWLQLSVFQCTLGPLRHRRLINELDGEIKKMEDHVLIFCLGPAGKRMPEVNSLGRSFEPPVREPVIV